MGDRDGVGAPGTHRVVRVDDGEQPCLPRDRQAAQADFEGGDTSSSVERFSELKVRSFQGDERNLKVTYPHDLFLAERLLANSHYRLT